MENFFALTLVLPNPGNFLPIAYFSVTSIPINLVFLLSPLAQDSAQLLLVLFSIEK